MISALSIWSCLKLLTLFRLVGGVLRNFGSAKSAYVVAATTTGPEAAAELMGGGGLLSPWPADVAGTSGSTEEAAVHAGIIVAGGDGDEAAGFAGQPRPMSSMDADCGAEPSGGYEAAASPRFALSLEEEGPGASAAASAAACLIVGSAVPLADLAPPATEVRSAEMSR